MSLALGCTATTASAGQPTTTVGAPWETICPPVIGGADAFLDRGEDRVALVLTATPAMADDVLERVRRLGDALKANPHLVLGAHAAVSKVDGGARLALAAEPGTVPRLGEEVAALLELMRSGGCPPLPVRVRAEPSAPREAHQPSSHHH